MNIPVNTFRSMVLAAIVAAPVAANAVWADEVKTLRPEIEQLQQTVADKIEAAADTLGLSKEQLDKIKEVRANRSEECKALRAERRALLQEELKAISSILTPEQREKVKEFAEDRGERREDRIEQADRPEERDCPDSWRRVPRWRSEPRLRPTSSASQASSASKLAAPRPVTQKSMPI